MRTNQMLRPSLIPEARKTSSNSVAWFFYFILFYFTYFYFMCMNLAVGDELTRINSPIVHGFSPISTLVLSNLAGMHEIP